MAEDQDRQPPPPPKNFQQLLDWLGLSPPPKPVYGPPLRQPAPVTLEPWQKGGQSLLDFAYGASGFGVNPMAPPDPSESTALNLGAMVGAAVPVVPAAKALRHLSLAPVERIAGRLFLSTRVPRAVKAEAATGGPLVTGVAEIAQDPALLSKIADKLRASPMLTRAQRAMNPRGVVDAITDVSSQNLAALIRLQPRKIRKQAAEWYPGGHRIGNQFAEAVGVTGDQGAAVLATQSPSKPWHQNVDLAERIMRRWKEFGTADPVFTPEIAQQYVQTALTSTEEWIRTTKLTGAKANRARARVQAKLAATEPFIGHRWSDLPLQQQARMMRAVDELDDPAQSYPIWAPNGTIAHPVALNKDGDPQRLVWQSYKNLENAISVLHDGSDANISLRVGQGHKVRSFFNNINVPEDLRSVTVDTHNVGGAHFRPMGGKAAEVRQVMGGPGSAATGIKGAHGVYRDAMIAASEAEGLPRPSAGQSVSWESIKGLFSPAQRRDKAFVATVRGMWENYSRGRMRLEDLHANIVEHAGGLKPPEWAK